jgi:tetratricopeptide (TPR) repeat protein
MWGLLAILSLSLLSPAQTPRKTSPPKSSPSPAEFERLSAEAARAREEDRLDDAIRSYNRALRLRPRWEEGWWYVGTIHYEKDRWPECRDAFSRFTAINPKLSPGFALLGLCEFRLDLWDQAHAHLNKAFQLGMPEDDPLTYVAWYHTALLETRARNFERALQILAMLSRKKPGEPELYAAAGLASLRKPLLLKQLPENERELALKLGQAVITAAERRGAEALAIFEEILTRWPSAPNVHYTFANYLLTIDAERGIEELKKELEISGEHLPGLVSLAMEYLKRGDPASALPFARRAAKAAPGNFTARTSLGRALTESGDLAGGIRELEAAVKLEPLSPQVRFYLASAYAKAGRKADADRERAEFTRLRKLIDSGGR